MTVFVLECLIYDVHLRHLAGQRRNLDAVLVAEKRECSYVVKWFLLLYPATQNMAGYYVIPPNRLSVRLSIRQPSFPDSNLSSFDRYSSNFAWTLISGRSGFGLQVG